MRKYLMCIAACLTAALVFTACSNDDEPAQESLAQKSFATVIEREGKSPYEMTVSFLDEKNIVIRTITHVSLPNGKVMAPTMDNIGTYTAKDGEGNAHITKITIKDDNSSMGFEAEENWTFTYDLKTGKMVFDGMVMNQTEFMPIELDDLTPPMTGAGTLPTIEDLQGQWFGMGTTSKGVTFLTLDVDGDQASVTLDRGINKSFNGTATYNNGVLTVGNCKIEVSAMDNSRSIKTATVYENGVKLATIVNLLKQ